jgi:hypothetical protein
MATIDWPHAHLAHALRDWLRAGATLAGARVYVQVPESRVWPFLVVQEAGLGPLGTDAAIQADEIRMQVDAWSERRDQALTLAMEAFALLDTRFGSLRNQTLTVADPTNPSTLYRSKVERCERAGGGEPWFDEIARAWRVTTYYHVKVNL